MAKTKLAETWRDWSEEDQAKQPKRVCSIAGCVKSPTRVRVTTTLMGAIRKHVYCEQHAAE